jgi:hypothetical protein
MVEDRGAPDATRMVKLYHRGIDLNEAALELLTQWGGRAHVVQVSEFGHSDGRGYEVMEHVAGGDLSGFRQRHGPQLEPSLVREMLQELADAVEHLHGLDLIHHDIKPDNVLVRDEERLELVVADFGLATVSDDTLFFASNQRRSARYAAPEVQSGYRGRPEDVWALGVMVTELLLGHHPLDHVSDEAVDFHLNNEPWPIDPEQVEGNGWRRLLGGMLIRDPHHRWTVENVQAWLAGDPDLPPPWVAPGHRRAASAFVFRGQPLTTRAEIAHALVEHWDEGVSRVRHNHLREWLARNHVHDPEFESFLDEFADSPWDEHGRLLRLSLRLDPEMEPWYHGRPATIAGLAHVAAEAVDQGPGSAANDIVNSIHDQDVIAAIADLTGSVEHTRVAREWREAEQRLQHLLGRSQLAPAEVGEALGGRGRAWLLRMITDPDERRRLERRVRRVRGGDLRPDWFRELTGPDAGAADLLIAATRDEDARAEVRQARRQRRNERIRTAQARSSLLARKSPWAVAALAGAAALRWPVATALLVLAVAVADAGGHDLARRWPAYRVALDRPQGWWSVPSALGRLLRAWARTVGAAVRTVLLAAVGLVALTAIVWVVVRIASAVAGDVVGPHDELFDRWLVPAVVMAVVLLTASLDRRERLPGVRQAGAAVRLAPTAALVALWLAGGGALWTAITNPPGDPWGGADGPIALVGDAVPWTSEAADWIADLVELPDEPDEDDVEPPEPEEPADEPSGPFGQAGVVWEVAGADRLNVRAGPGLDEESPPVLAAGHARPATGEHATVDDTVWVELELGDGATGWSSTRYLQPRQD